MLAQDIGGGGGNVQNGGHVKSSKRESTDSKAETAK